MCMPVCAPACIESQDLVVTITNILKLGNSRIFAAIHVEPIQKPNVATTIIFHRSIRLLPVGKTAQQTAHKSQAVDPCAHTTKNCYPQRQMQVTIEPASVTSSRHPYLYEIHVLILPFCPVFIWKPVKGNVLQSTSCRSNQCVLPLPRGVSSDW